MSSNTAGTDPYELQIQPAQIHMSSNTGGTDPSGRITGVNTRGKGRKNASKKTDT